MRITTADELLSAYSRLEESEQSKFDKQHASYMRMADNMNEIASLLQRATPEQLKRVRTKLAEKYPGKFTRPDNDE